MPTVEETVEEALLIAGVAVRTALKNLIIVRSLRDGEDYSELLLLDAIREEFLNLVEEKAEDAVRVERQHEIAARTEGRATTLTDFRIVDAPALERRAAVLRLLSNRLRLLAEDSEYAANLMASVRDEALDDVLGAFALAQTRPPGNTSLEVFERERSLRLIADDLESLAIARQIAVRSAD